MKMMLKGLALVLNAGLMAAAAENGPYKIVKSSQTMGSGGIESANKFICHVRLKRSGAWWYVTNANQMLALRCAKYNGTFARVFERYRRRIQERAGSKAF